MDRDRFQECMEIGAQCCNVLANTPLNPEKKSIQNSLMCNKIDANLLRFSSVQGIVAAIDQGIYTKEQGLFYIVNLLGNQLLAVVDDVDFYEECKELEDNIQDYIGKVAFTTIIEPNSEGERDED